MVLEDLADAGVISDQEVVFGADRDRVDVEGWIHHEQLGAGWRVFADRSRRFDAIGRDVEVAVGIDGQARCRAGSPRDGQHQLAQMRSSWREFLHSAGAGRYAFELIGDEHGSAGSYVYGTAEYRIEKAFSVPLKPIPASVSRSLGAQIGFGGFVDFPTDHPDELPFRGELLDPDASRKTAFQHIDVMESRAGRIVVDRNANRLIELTRTGSPDSFEAGSGADLQFVALAVGYPPTERFEKYSRGSVEDRDPVVVGIGDIKQVSCFIHRDALRPG